MSFGRRFVTMVAAVAGLTLSTGVEASAQTTPLPPTPAVTAGWNDGFVIQSADGDNRLQLGVTLQADGRFSLDDPRPITNTFVMRKARPTFSGRVAKYFDFKLMPELAGGTTFLLDAYFDIRFSPKFRLRSGKDKTPVGYELLLGDATLIFPERSVVSLLVPNRDVGFQAQGELAGGRLLYAGGVFNGQPVDGSSSATDTDVNDGKDLAGRIVVLPFRSTRAPSLLSNLGFHLGASTGNQTGPLPSFRTSAGQSIFAFAATTADGRRNRISPAVFIYAKGFGAYAEYARTRQDVVRNGTSATIVNHAWQVTASYVVTGEATSDRGVRPRAPFDPSRGTWGAVQVAARYGELALDDAIFGGGMATEGSSRTARQATAGVDWFLNNYIKMYGTFERFTLNDGSRDAENVIIFRTQLAF
jgi:phosphate-selective porin OprO and OprP